MAVYIGVLEWLKQSLHDFSSILITIEMNLQLFFEALKAID